MASFWVQILGGLLLLASWIVLKRLGRSLEQSFLVYRRALDGKARAEDGYLTCLTLRRILDAVVYMQQTLGFPDQLTGSRETSQGPHYVTWAATVQSQLDQSRRAYAFDRLNNVWVAVKGSEPDESQKSIWKEKSEEELQEQGDEPTREIDGLSGKLEANTRRADRLSVGMYVLGAVLLLVGGQSLGV